MNMNTKSLMKYIAQQLPAQGINLSWDIRGEIGNEEIDENKTLIAVCHCLGSNEIVYRNFTYNMNCQLTGQILLNCLSGDKISEEVDALYNALANYIKSLHYTDCDGAIILEGTCGALNVETDNLYYVFSIPFTLYTQF